LFKQQSSTSVEHETGTNVIKDVVNNNHLIIMTKIVEGLEATPFLAETSLAKNIFFTHLH
jgi:hypothetical protein